MEVRSRKPKCKQAIHNIRVYLRRFNAGPVVLLILTQIWAWIDIFRNFLAAEIAKGNRMPFLNKDARHATIAQDIMAFCKLTISSRNLFKINKTYKKT